MKTFFITLLFILFATSSSVYAYSGLNKTEERDLIKKRILYLLVQVMKDPEYKFKAFDVESGEALTLEEIEYYDKMFLQPKALEEKGLFKVQIAQTEVKNELFVSGCSASNIGPRMVADTRCSNKTRSFDISLHVDQSTLVDSIVNHFKSLGRKIWIGFGY